MKHISRSSQPLNTWSGGTTRQVWIFPEESSYAERNFEIRISTATVEVQESTFTSLPAYSRTLMVLEGELKVEHKDRHTVMLKKFDTDRFLGDWETKGFGKCIDFNVMCTSQKIVTLDVIGEEKKLVDYNATVDMAGFYIHKGEMLITSAGGDHYLCEGDFLLLEENECSGRFTILPAPGAEVIAVTIRHRSH